MKLLGIFSAIVLTCCALLGCNSEGRTKGPSTNVTAVHAAPTFGQIAFLREEQTAATLDYRGASTSSWEVGQYDFNLEFAAPGATAATRRTFSETLVDGTTYFFVVTEIAGQLEPLIVTKPPFASTSSNAEVMLVHAAPTFAAADVYLAAPGIDLASANPIGTVTFTQSLPPQTFSAGDYQLSFTEPGNPANVLFTSPTLTLAAGQPNLFVITDGAGEGLAPINTVRLANATTVLTDVNAPAAVRAINAASDTLPRDIVVDDNYATPLFPALAYAAPTDFAAIAPGTRKITVTPAGNPGVVEGSEAAAVILGGRVFTTLVAGAAGSLKVTTIIEDRRRIAGQARLRLLNGAGQFTSLDFFVLPVGSNIGAYLPLALAAGSSSGTQTLAPGTHELTIRISGTATIALGPVPVNFPDDGIYTILALNGATAETASVTLLDDFN